MKGTARIRFLDDGEEFDAELHWSEAHGIGKVEMKQRASGLRIMNSKPQFAICIRNDDYPASLQLWKVYRVLPDEKGARHNMIRVVDESGEDYHFFASYFVPVKLPQIVESALLATV